MKIRRYGLVVFTAAVLAGCGGSQRPIGTPGVFPLSPDRMQQRSERNAGGGTSIVEFAYVANLYSNNVSAYAINESNGALSPVRGSPFAADYGSCQVAIDPTGKFAYVANNGTVSGKPGSVSGFAINPRSGALTPVHGSPFAAGKNPIGVAISPNGEFVYVPNYNSASVSIFAINARTGALKAVKGAPHRTRPSPTAEAVDPAANFIYVTHVGLGNPYDRAGHIAGYAINPRSGALRELRGTVLRTWYFPASAAIDPFGKFVYVANYLAGNVSAFVITAGTGALSEVKGSPFRTGDNPAAVAIDPNGSFAYVAFQFGVGGYSIGPAGALTPIRGSPFVGGSEPDGAAIDPLGKFAYVGNTANGDVYAYTINPSDGALTQVSGSPFAAGSGPAGVATCEVVRNSCVPAKL